LRKRIYAEKCARAFMLLMHGDRDVSLKRLARELDVKSVATCSPKDAQRYTGYMVGGISPFGIRRDMPIYIKKTLLKLRAQTL